MIALRVAYTETQTRMYCKKLVRRYQSSVDCYPAHLERGIRIDSCGQPIRVWIDHIKKIIFVDCIHFSFDQDIGGEDANGYMWWDTPATDYELDAEDARRKGDILKAKALMGVARKLRLRGCLEIEYRRIDERRRKSR